MLNRLLPILAAAILVALLIFLFVRKKLNIKVGSKTFAQKSYIQLNRKLEIALGSSLLALQISFIIWFVVTKGAYLYLLQTDLCTMLYPWIGISLIFNFKKVQKLIMPWIIVGGIFELATMKLTYLSENLADEIPSIIKHILLVLSGIYILMTVIKFTWKDFGFSLVWIICFIIYIILVQGIPFWVTHDPRFGAFSMALIESSYKEVNVSWTDKSFIVSEYSVLNSLGGYPGGMLVMYAAAVGVVALTSWGAISLTKNKTEK